MWYGTNFDFNETFLPDPCLSQIWKADGETDD